MVTSFGDIVGSASEVEWGRSVSNNKHLAVVYVLTFAQGSAPVRHFSIFSNSHFVRDPRSRSGTRSVCGTRCTQPWRVPFESFILLKSEMVGSICGLLAMDEKKDSMFDMRPPLAGSRRSSSSR